MRCVRVFVFIFLMIFTAAATCSSLFPLFRKSATENQKDVVYYWYKEFNQKITVTGVSPTYSVTRTYSRDSLCERYKTFYIVCGALAAGGAAFGGAATLMSLAHIYIRPKCCMCFGIIFFAFLAFACFVVCVALTAYSYTTDLCGDGANQVKSFKSQDYKIVEGFGLQCAAAGGFLISMLLEICA